MLADLPKQYSEAKDWTWDDIRPFYEALESRDLTADNVNEWLADWTALGNVLGEVFSRAHVRTTQDTSDEAAETEYKRLLETVYPQVIPVETRLQQKLVASGLQPANFEIPLKKMRTDVELFREENIPLQTRAQTLGLEYNKITGSMTVEWDGEEITLVQLKKVLQDEDRATREKAWRLLMDRWMRDRDAINALWVKLFDTRMEMTKNAGFDNYRALRWQQLHRYDYAPDDCITFHNAIEQVVVPAAQRRNEARRQALGLDSLRPWDLDVDTSGKPALSPWDDIEEFKAKAGAIFNRVDPKLGGYFDTMRREDLMDLPNRKNKGPGAYCTGFPLLERPFVFMNANGTRDDVRVLLHEFGHAFHGFETMASLPYEQQRNYPMEFAEVASMAMELLAAPYLTRDEGGFYSSEEAARDRISHLEKILFFWPYMAVVDSFQHWVYTSGDAARNPANCDAKWAELWDRFIKLDYTGLEEEKKTGWHRKLHIHRLPFYYIEYGVAELGAVQVWANALTDQAQAVADYRKALALGGTRSLPELFGTAGAKFAFDAGTLGGAVELIERTIESLEKELA